MVACTLDIIAYILPPLSPTVVGPLRSLLALHFLHLYQFTHVIFLVIFDDLKDLLNLDEYAEVDFYLLRDVSIAYTKTQPAGSSARRVHHRAESLRSYSTNVHHFHTSQSKPFLISVTLYLSSFRPLYPLIYTVCSYSVSNTYVNMCCIA